jgi:hypothetical protein
MAQKVAPNQEKASVVENLINRFHDVLGLRNENLFVSRVFINEIAAGEYERLINLYVK